MSMGCGRRSGTVAIKAFLFLNLLLLPNFLLANICNSLLSNKNSTNTENNLINLILLAEDHPLKALEEEYLEWTEDSTYKTKNGPEENILAKDLRRAARKLFIPYKFEDATSETVVIKKRKAKLNLFKNGLKLSISIPFEKSRNLSKEQVEELEMLRILRLHEVPAIESIYLLINRIEKEIDFVNSNWDYINKNFDDYSLRIPLLLIEVLGEKANATFKREFDYVFYRYFRSLTDYSEVPNILSHPHILKLIEKYSQATDQISKNTTPPYLLKDTFPNLYATLIADKLFVKTEDFLKAYEYDYALRHNLRHANEVPSRSLLRSIFSKAEIMWLKQVFLNKGQRKLQYDEDHSLFTSITQDFDFQSTEKKADILTRLHGSPGFEGSLPKYRNRVIEFLGGKKIIEITDEAPEMVEKVLPLTNPSYIERAKRYLKKTIIGQPEIIAEFSRLFDRFSIQKPGSLKVAGNFWLLGLPGTGKDVSARTLANSLNGNNSNAWKTHMFATPPIKDIPSLSSLKGSPTGFIGSADIPEILPWLVLHSGGEYILKKNKHAASGGSNFKIIRNNNWQEGQILEGYFSPSQAVLFVNEVHDWPKAAKNDWLKEVLEYRRFSITNPGGGLSEINVNVHIVMASNNGIDLVTSRDSKGARVGKRLTYEQMLEKYELNHLDKDKIRDAITSQESGVGNSAKGTSEELISRVGSLILMKPHSPKNLQKIAEITLKSVIKSISESSEFMSDIAFKLDESVRKLIQEHKYSPEAGARDINQKVATLIEDTFVQMIVKNIISKSDLELINATLGTITMSVEKNPDYSYDLVLRSEDLPETKRMLIEKTKENIPEAIVSEEVLAETRKYKRIFSNRVFGQKRVTDRVAEKVAEVRLILHKRMNETNATKSATSFMFFGLSSTGKTQLAKTIAEVVYGTKDAFTSFEMGKVKTIADVKKLFLGTTDVYGKFQPSELAKAHKRRNGKLVIALEEASDVPREVWNSFLELLREPIITLENGEDMIMSHTIITFTGNIGDEWYKDVPDNFTPLQRHNVYQSIYKQSINDSLYQREYLIKKFGEPLLNRIGQNNIFFFAPHSHQSKREVASLVLAKALKKVQANIDGLNWDVRFKNSQEYFKMLEAMEEHVFELSGQAATLVKFSEDLAEKIKTMLFTNEVELGAQVELSYINKSEAHKLGHLDNLNFKLTVLNKADSKQNQVKFSIPVSKVNDYALRPESMQIETAGHEIGHLALTRFLFPAKKLAKMVSIIPGVFKFQGKWLAYEGVAESKHTEKFAYTREAIIREIAVLMAGGAAQELITNNFSHDAGKSNDIERATYLAEVAILKLGLAKESTWQAIPTGTDLNQYRNSLSPKQREELSKEVNKFLEEGYTLASEALFYNIENILIPFTIALARKGVLMEKDINELFRQHPVIKIPTPEQKKLFKQFMDNRAKANKTESPEMGESYEHFLTKPIDAKLIDQLKDIEVADVETILTELKKLELKKAKLDGENLPIFN